MDPKRIVTIPGTKIAKKEKDQAKTEIAKAKTEIAKAAEEELLRLAFQVAQAKIAAEELLAAQEEKDALREARLAEEDAAEEVIRLAEYEAVKAEQAAIDARRKAEYDQAVAGAHDNAYAAIFKASAIGVVFAWMLFLSTAKMAPGFFKVSEDAS
ncbi:hypothetical protein T484DRAFT_1922636 [Baffinella frigidus]|nr:hypothetical protein T484DRAFT_1922636 [Cryptophyta sp. CCMP2293]